MAHNSFLRRSMAVFLALVTTAPAMALADNWEQIHESEGVTVYQRDAQQMDGLAFRGVTEADVDIGRLMAVFIDPDDRPNWVYRFQNQEMVEQDDPVGQSWSELYWVRIDMPFPTTDRDYVFQTDYQLHPQDRRVTTIIQSVNDPRVSQRDCCIRAESITHYTFEALPGQERTRIDIQVETDLGGRLPGWLTRRAEREFPVETLTSLIERAQQLEEGDDRFDGWHEDD